MGVAVRVKQLGRCWQVTTFPGVFPVNAYLIDEGDQLTLVDTGLPLSASGILRAAARIGRPITRIALTHAHQDHAGAVDRLVEALPQAEVACSRREAPLLAGDL